MNKFLRNTAVVLSMATLAVYCSACGSAPTDGKNGENGKDGINGESAYELYLKYNPSYEGNEEQWVDDYMLGNLTEKHYTILSKRNLAANVQTGTVTYGANFGSFDEVKFENAVLALNEPLILPLNKTSEWTIAFKGTYMPNGIGGGQLLTSYAGSEGRVYLGVNWGKSILFMGVLIDGQYSNYCWDVSQEVLKGDHAYQIDYRDGEYLLSIDGGELLRFSNMNLSQGNNIPVSDSKAASAQLTQSIRAITGQDFVKITNIGADSHKCTCKFTSITAHTSPLYGYRELVSHPLADKNIYYLGSSVTRGHGGDTDGNSFADIIANLTGNSYQKEAISGTTLALKTAGDESYVSRLGLFDFTNEPDVLVVQLSTNDFSQGIPQGAVSIGTAPGSFDKATITGAIEYIIAKVHEVSPETKIVLYTCPLAENWGKYSEYGAYIRTTVVELAEKWQGTLEVLNLYNADYIKNPAYMQSDGLHPTKAGYAHVFVPNLINLLIKTFQLEK